jgi:hypothetical protein
MLEQSSPVKESEMFMTFNRIDKRIESLKNILSPILKGPTPEGEVLRIEASTELMNRLSSIEHNLDRLAESIEL